MPKSSYLGGQRVFLFKIFVMGFRDYYLKTLNDLCLEELQYTDEWRALRNAKQRLRMYANLFCRDVRKILITETSSCASCGTLENLQIDHIKSISKGGLNTIDNVQILCGTCNLKKGNNDHEHI